MTDGRDITLATARTILQTAFSAAAELRLKPLAIAVLDARGVLKAFEAQDGTVGLARPDIAHGKAHGALALGQGSRAINKRMQDSPHLVNAMMHVAGGALVAVPGGVLVRDGNGRILGAVGVSGDTSDNDEAVAMAGIRAAGLVADGG
ncbi:MAG: heme-binding protein [Alphaproteobacteria bacterium]|nr:heme-binding protein [Alphaproteobacteria bacterium]